LLEEAVEIIRALFAGGNVNYRGRHFRVEHAELFTRPLVPPPILLAASGRDGAG
jgi:alkanesulfonate monooxygenase SsuD/methylene tetrahydromethanopterin reductase-like flavin-dependent oxidoreductase (luciferase family)